MRDYEIQRANKTLRKTVRCSYHNCAGNKKGACHILVSTDWGDKLCPFYKTAEQNEKERKAVMAKLIAQNRYDLINTYYGSMEGGADHGC